MKDYKKIPNSSFLPYPKNHQKQFYQLKDLNVLNMINFIIISKKFKFLNKILNYLFFQIE